MQSVSVAPLEPSIPGSAQSLTRWPPTPRLLAVLGMDLIDEHDAGDFKLFFLAFPDSPSANAQSRAHREGIVELTWNKGTEVKPDFKYHNGNNEPQGFGHLCVSVPDLDEACARFEKMGVAFKKRPQEGKMRHIAFIYDPDGYWVEIIPLNKKNV